MAASRRPRRPPYLPLIVNLSKCSIIYLFLLTILLLSASASNTSTAKSVHDCKPGFLFCEYYGCQQVPMCPQVCESIGDESMCTRTFDGTSCKWERGVCSRDVKCEGSDGMCSSDCMHCNTFGCVPKASQCPQACALYSLLEQCESAPKIGSVSCDWSENRCQTVDEKSTNTQPAASSTPSTLPTFNPEADPDFGNIYSKRAWAGTVGIIVGVIFGLLGLLGIIFLIWHRLRERRRRLNSDAALHFTHTTMYRPQSFIHALRSVVDHNARELEAVAPLSPLPPAQRSPR